MRAGIIQNDFKLYFLLEPDKDEVRYVGITKNTLEERFYKHLRDKHRNYRCNWIKGLLNENTCPRIVSVAEGLTKEEAIKEEIFYIAYLKFCGARLTNGTCGGDGTWGHIVTPEVRNRLRVKSSGRKVSVETRLKMSVARKGKKHSAQSIARMRISKTGTKHSEGAKQKISRANTGRKVSEEQKKQTSLRFKGKPLSEELKKKLSAAGKRRIVTDEQRNRLQSMAKARIGKELSEEHRLKLSVNHASKKPDYVSPDLWGDKNPMWGKTHSVEAREKIRQARSCKGITSNEVVKIRQIYAQGNTSYTKMGLMFGVSPRVIEGIIKRRTWREAV